MELVYELNAPKFTDFFKEEILLTNDDSLSFNLGIYENIEKFIKPNYINFMNFKWRDLLYFKKSNNIGLIHMDIQESLNREKTCIWGINWIVDGDGILEYWDFSDLIECSAKMYEHIERLDFTKVPNYIPLKQSNKKYIQKKDKVYLVNGSFPHRAIGKTNRKAFSLRSYEMSMPWEKVIDIFKPIII